MKIYTKTGDQGDTGLISGGRVTKDHVAIEVCGSLDETNSAIGLACSHGLPVSVDSTLKNVQQDLFLIGSSVANCENKAKKWSDPDFGGEEQGAGRIHRPIDR